MNKGKNIFGPSAIWMEVNLKLFRRNNFIDLIWIVFDFYHRSIVKGKRVLKQIKDVDA